MSRYSASGRVCCINFHTEMIEICKLKSEVSIFIVDDAFNNLFFTFANLIFIYLTHKSPKMLDNKSKTSLITHIPEKKIYYS